MHLGTGFRCNFCVDFLFTKAFQERIHCMFWTPLLDYFPCMWPFIYIDGVFGISRIKVETLVILNNQQRHSRCLWKTAFWLADPPPVPPSFHPFSHSIWFCALRVFSPLPSFLLMYTHHSTSSKYFAKLTAAVLENELLRVFLTSL